jgi:membrane protein YdbS with pleckstrin-like domain
MIFTNEQIHTAKLPSLDEVEFEKLDPAHRRMSLMQSGFLSLGLCIAYFIGSAFESMLFQTFYLSIFLTTWVLFSVMNLTLSYYGHEKAGFALRERDVLYKSGIFFQEVQAVPFTRIQHCELSQGPLERYFGLSSVSVFTAGGSSSDLEIEGLSREKAILLKNYILRNAAIDEEE